LTYDKNFLIENSIKRHEIGTDVTELSAFEDSIGKAVAAIKCRLYVYKPANFLESIQHET